MKAIWNEIVIADSDETIEIEGNHYFPSKSIKNQYFEESRTHSTCPWKGEASYYHVKVNGEVNPDAAWYYPDPKDAASEIRNYVAFWKGIEVKE